MQWVSIKQWQKWQLKQSHLSGVSDARNVHVKNSISRSVKHVKRVFRAC